MCSNSVIRQVLQSPSGSRAGVEEIQYISSFFFVAIYKPEINKRNIGQFLNNVIQVGIVGGDGGRGTSKKVTKKYLLFFPH